MRQLLDYFRLDGFQAFIASGGGIEFMGVFAEDSYGVLPSQGIGSSLRTRVRQKCLRAEFIRLADLDFSNDGPGKPDAIGRFIGRRSVLVVGSSDGDPEMFRYVDAGDDPSLNVPLLHNDITRAYAYDRESLSGKLGP
jgi:hypothetical protein